MLPTCLHAVSPLSESPLSESRNSHAAWAPALLLTCSVRVWTNPINSSVIQFPHLSVGNNYSPQSIRLWWERNKWIWIKILETFCAAQLRTRSPGHRHWVGRTLEAPGLGVRIKVVLQGEIRVWLQAGKVLAAQSCPPLCDSMDCSLPGFSAHGILQLTRLDWVAISFSRGSSNPGIETESPASQADSLVAQTVENLSN